MEEQFVDTSRVELRIITTNIAKQMIVKYHYSHAWPASTQAALGVFYKTGKGHKFLDEEDEKMIGCIVYGNPVGRRAAASIIESDEIDPHESVYELTRLFIHDGYGKNIESYVIGQSFKWLKENIPQIKMLISYADPAQGHVGGIYKATNWGYQSAGDMKLMFNYPISLTKDPYDWIHSRTVFSRYGVTPYPTDDAIAKMKKAVGQTFWMKRECVKHRYIQFLVDKREKRKLIKLLKHPFRDYPTSADDDSEIIEVQVDSGGKFGKFI